MTLLDDIIYGSTDDTVSTANLLRKVQIAATLLGADSIVLWAKGELSGYDLYEPDLLPQYRSRLALPVTGHFEGPFNTSARGVTLSRVGTSEDFVEAWFKVDLFQPLAELERLANSEGSSEPQFAWSPEAVQMYRQWGAEGRTLHMEMMELFAASLVFPRTAIHGIVEKVRNKAMEFGLELQCADPDAGSPGGPTISEPAIESAVKNTTINIYGHGTNVATGSNIRQKTTVSVGDVGALREAARSYGLDEAAAAEFVSIIEEDMSVESARALGFLERARNGAVGLGGSIAGNLAASGLIEAASQFLGQ